MEGALAGVSLMPAVAHRFNDQWSVGAAINATYGILGRKTALSNGSSGTDGSMQTSDNTWGVGGNIGFMYEPNKKTRWGLTYNSPITLSFSSTPSYTNIGSGLDAILRASGLYDRKIDQTYTIPQQVMLGFSREMNPRWTLLGDVGWQNWSAFRYKQITVESSTPVSVNRELHGQDTFHAALGAKYMASPKWTLTFGVGYDTSAFDDANRPSLMPFGAVWRFGVGATTTLNPTSALNFGYEALLTGNLAVDQQGALAGTYAQGILHFFTVNFERKF